MKKLSRIILPVMLFFSLSISAQAKEIFLCMQNEQNTAFSIDKNGVLEYIDMCDSNGVKVIAQISGDGNTYLPFRFICEMAGFADAEEEGMDGDYFRFVNNDPNNPQSRQRIEICKDNNVVSHEVGVEFSYEVSEGDVRNVCIYNIEGTLYFPMTYMTKITDAKTFWCEETKDIIFATSGVDVSKYINSSAMLLDSAKNMAFYYPSLDADKVSGYYISSKGTLKKLKEVRGDIYRIKNRLYYMDDEGLLMIQEEDTDAKEAFLVWDSSANAKKISVEDFVIVKNSIYGIDSSNSRLFSCDFDGKNFEYLTQNGVFGMLLRQYGGREYIYYCDKEQRCTVSVLHTFANDIYDVEITDFAHNNLLCDISSFSVTDTEFLYTDNGGINHTISLPDPLEEFEIARIFDGGHQMSTE